ncbi:hypothetical protein ACIBL8_47265 [Streptomyces sp. NPDC050523]|uniref:hypothetical protein n=1 Tax=Streptomyces sp. NPDC050523 TaxID=3365622 RepID=UPI00378A538C
MTAAAPEFLASLASALVLAATQQTVKVLRQRRLSGRQDKSVLDKKHEERAAENKALEPVAQRRNRPSKPAETVMHEMEGWPR